MKIKYFSLLFIIFLAGCSTGPTDYSNDLCKNVSIYDYDYCLMVEASDTQNISLCDQVPNSELRYKCYPIVAVNNNNSELCKNVGYGELVDYCYHTYSVLKNDSTYCQKVSDIDRKNLCLEYFSN